MARLRPPPDPTPAALPVNGFPRGLLNLSDRGLEIVMAAAHPIAPAMRSQFLEAVAQRLAGVPELGDGVVSRACRELQGQFFEPPDTSRSAAGGAIPAPRRTALSGDRPRNSQRTRRPEMLKAQAGAGDGLIGLFGHSYSSASRHPAS
jgi:hypothetical protein